MSSRHWPPTELFGMSSSLAFVWLLQVTAASFFAAQAELLPVYNPRPGRRVIVFQSTVFGHELCLSDNWHGTLPRYIAQVLHGTEAIVIAWDGFASLQGKDDCWICHGTTPLMMSINSPPRRFKCQDWFGSSGNPKAADIAVFLACTKRVLQECAQQTRRGDLKCPELEEPLQGEHIGLQWCHSQPWVHRHYTRTVHLPVSKPMEERKMQFGLDVVIDDHEYLKPTPVMTLTGWNPDKTKQIICNPTVRRTNTFLYIARIGSDQKGHISFLERIDPGLLERYRIVFFSGLNSTVSQKTKDQMMEIALRRGIDIEVHLDRVPIETLLETACLSLGLIEYSKRDQNPRVVYEMLYAGLPVFVTLDAHTPNELNSQPFVQLTNYTAEGLEGGRLNRDFRSFLAIVHQPNIRDEIERFLRDEMVPEQIYARLCVKMGICTSSIASIDL